ncbi:hypothetical protein JL720_14747 [Aureococcus anophagefferens]|nr:hypothetical protein JL720_14747 [Aureococcus anophagefferens]
MYLQLQRIKRAGACDDLNDCEPGGLFAVDGRPWPSTSPTCPSRSAPCTGASAAARGAVRRVRPGKRRPSSDAEPDSPKTPGSPGVAAFARSFAAAARKRQALRLGKLATGGAARRGAAGGGGAPPPPAVDEPSPRLMAKAKPCAATIALADIRNPPSPPSRANSPAPEPARPHRRRGTSPKTALF